MNGNAIASTAGLGDIVGGVDYDNAHRLARHLASYITDATAIRSYVKYQTGREIDLRSVVKMIEERRKPRTRGGWR